MHSLESMLKGRWMHGRTKYGRGRKHHHLPVTAIVGNPHSFKRNLAMCAVFSNTSTVTIDCDMNPGCNRDCSLCDKNSSDTDPHVMIVLLDKDPEEMRKKIICPSIASKKGEIDSKCSECYRRISFLNFNAGCITPEEFCSMLHEQIRVYIGYYNKRPPKKRRPLHIVIDDFHRIDFSYPFLSSSRLFTNALISVCEENNVSITILCDKSSKRVREVCTLADYVMCVEREENDVPAKITIYAERMGDYGGPSMVMKYKVSDALRMMTCENGQLSLNKEVIFTPKQLGSMKEYWRQTYNVLPFQKGETPLE